MNTMIHDRPPRLVRSLVAVAAAGSLALLASCGSESPVQNDGKLSFEAANLYGNSLNQHIDDDGFTVSAMNRSLPEYREYDTWGSGDDAGSTTRNDQVVLNLTNYRCTLDNVEVTVETSDFAVTSVTEYRVNQLELSPDGKHIVASETKKSLIVKDGQGLVDLAKGKNPCDVFSLDASRL